MRCYNRLSFEDYTVIIYRSPITHEVEDPTAVDESMRDFTFKVEELQEELDEHRRKLNIEVSGTVTVSAQPQKEKGEPSTPKLLCLDSLALE